MNKEITTPVVGMGASYGAGADSYPATIVEVSPNGKTLFITDDSYRATKDSDHYTNQAYVYTSNMDAPKKCYTLRKNGRWIPKGVPISAGYTALSIGHRRYYQDPHF
ncbi:MAG: hypothetical protein ACI9J3_003306 [Parvicellaceae bacterium]|jgi:hypothetical protein